MPEVKTEEKNSEQASSYPLRGGRLNRCRNAYDSGEKRNKLPGWAEKETRGAVCLGYSRRRGEKNGG